MPPSIAPSFGPGAAASAASSHSASGARGRSADEPDGSNFHAVLNRSRGGGSSSAPTAEDASALEGAVRRKPGRGANRGEELSAEPLPLAFFAPLPGSLPAARLPADAPAAARGAQAGAPGLVADAAAADLPAAEAGAAVTAVVEAASSTPAPSADEPARAMPQANGDEAQPVAQASAGLPADAIAPPTATDAEAAVPAPTADATRTAARSDAADELPVAAPDDIAATSTAADLALRATEPPAQGPSTPAASLTLGLPPAMPAEGMRTNLPPASVHTPTLMVEPSVGSEAWGRAIGQQMLRMSAAGYQVAELNLNPAGLGPLKVTLSMADNQAQAMFFSAHESVRRAVEAALPQLRASMADNGISLGQASVGAEAHPSPGQGGAFGQDAQQQQQQQQALARRANLPAFGAEPGAAAAQPTAPAAAPRRPDAAVDTFA